MKIQKRALSLVLALSMAVTAFSGTAAFATEDSGEPYFTVGNVPETVLTEEKFAEDENGQISSFNPAGRTPVSVSIKKGDSDFTNVRVTVQCTDKDGKETDDVQLIAKDTDDCWWNIAKSGWGPPEGFQLADATTDVYLVASQPGAYTATIQLVNVTDKEVLTETEVSVTAAESTVLPAEGDWEGPAGDPETPLTAKTEQSFVFPFKTTGGTSLSELQLDIYLGDKAGEGRDDEGHAYNEAVQLNLFADASVSANFTVASLNELLGQIPEDKEKEKENTIKLLKAAGAEFDDAGSVNSVEKLQNNISYTYDVESGTGTWTIKLDTTKLGESKIEFLTMVRAGDEAVWGNNNYVSYGDETKAYCYTITAPEEPDKTIVRFAGSDKTLTLPKGTEEEKIPFSDTLTVYYSDKTHETLKGIKWECDSFDTNTEGRYIFTPVLNDYQIGEGVSIPTVTVIIFSEDVVPAIGVHLSGSSVCVGALGATHQWKAMFNPSNATNKNVTWESSDSKVATIDQNGLMTYVAYGETTITVTAADGGFTDSRKVTIKSQEAYDEEVTNAANAVTELPEASETTTIDEDTAGAIKTAVSKVQDYGEDVTKKLDAAKIDNLESLLAKLTDGKVSKEATVAAPNGMDADDKIPAAPDVSGLLLASGITGDEDDAQVSLKMEQSEPTVEGALLAFDLKLTVAQSESEPEEIEPAIPVTVTGVSQILCKL